MLVLTAVLVKIIQSTPTTGTDILLRQQHGVIFNRAHKTLLTGHANYLVTFKIDIPWSYKMLKPKFRKLLSQYLADTWPEIVRLDNDTRAIDSEITSLMPAPKSSSRIKRGLLNVVGNFARYAFGISTTDDIKKVWSAISKLNNYAQQAHETTELSANFLHHQANLTSDRLNNMQKEINIVANALKENRAYIRELVSGSENVTRGVKRLHRALRAQGQILAQTTQYFQILYTLGQTVQRQNAFLYNLRLLRKGEIASNLILPSHLKVALQKVTTTLRLDNPTYSLLHHDVGWYLTSGLRTFSYTKEHLFVSLAIPVANSPVLYDVWRISTVRVPLVTNSASLYDGSTKIMNLPEFLAVNSEGTQFIELTSTDVASCDFDTQVTCRAPLLTVDRLNVSCTVALYLGQNDKIRSQCVAHYSTAPLPKTEIIKVNDSSFLISTMETNYELVCQDRQVIRRKLCSYCVLVFPCFCMVSFGNKRLQIPYTECSTQTETVLEYHLFNAMLLHSFNLTDLIEELPEFSMEPYISKLPSLSNITRTLQPLRIKDEQDTLTLTQLTKEYEADLAKEPDNLPWLMNEENTMDIGLVICSTIAIIVGVLNMVGLIFLTKKLVRLQTIVGFVSIAATETAGLVLKEARPPNQPQTTDFIEENSYEGSTVVIISCAVLMVFLVLARHSVTSFCRKLSNVLFPQERPFFTQLFLAFDMADNHEIIKIGDISTAPNLIRYVTAPRLNNAVWLTQTRLTFQWSNGGIFKYFINNVPHDYLLPAVLNLTRFKSRAVRKIINRTGYTTRLLFSYEGHDAYIQIPSMLLKPDEAPIYALDQKFLPCDVVQCTLSPFSPRVSHTPVNRDGIRDEGNKGLSTPVARRLYPTLPHGDYLDMSQLQAPNFPGDPPVSGRAEKTAPPL